MKKIVSETIDGSIKSIIQLKTLDASLEYSQLFDALEDCPQEFQSKLVGALNSLGETMQIPPTEVFNKVLCKSDEDEDVKKKLYNWWRAVFEVLSQCDIPDDGVEEYNQKVDDLMAEILKAGDGEATAEEEPEDVFAEEYEPASMKDEAKMLENMDFAIQELGEVATKVQDLVNFVNPYCGTEVNESGDQPKFKVGDVVRVMNASGMDFYGRDAPIGPIVKIEPPHPDVGVYEYLIKGRSGEFFAYEDELELVPERFTEEENSKMKKITKERGGFGLEPDYDNLPDDWGSWNNYDGDEDDEGWDMDSADYEMSDDERREAWRERHPYLEKGEEGGDEMNGGPWLPENEIIGMKVTGESGGEMSINLTSAEKADFESCVEDYIIQAEERHGSESDMVIGVAASMALRWIEMICAKDCAKFNPEDVIINWVDDGPEDEFAVATGNSQSVYDFVAEMYEEVSDYTMGSGTRGKPESDDEEFMEAGHENLDAEGFIDMMTNGAGATPLFDPYNGTVEKDGTVVLNVIAHREQVSYKDVQNGFAEQAAEYGWEFKSFGYSDDLTSGMVDDGNVEIDVVFAPMQQVGENLENELKKGDDGWTTIGQHVGESKVSITPEMKKKAEEYVLCIWRASQGDDRNALSGRDLYQLAKFLVHNKIIVSYGGLQDDDSIKVDGLKVGEIVRNYSSRKVNGEYKELKPRIKWYDDEMVNEARVVVDANDVWDVLELLDNDIAHTELTDLINSHVRTEEEIMDAINELCGETISKKELNTLLSGRMVTLVDYLGLDVEQYEDMGNFVDSDKPTSVELEGSTDDIKGGEVKDGEKKVTQDGETKTLVAGEGEKKEMSDAEAATIMGGASATDMDAADMGISSHEVADPYKKKPVCEMTVEQEVDDPWKLSEMLWSQGKENLQELLRSELVGEEDIMMLLEDSELRNLTSINDAFAFDFPSILDSLGLDGEAWSQDLEIKRKGEEPVDEAKKKTKVAGDPEAQKIEDAIPVDDKDGFIKIEKDERYGAGAQVAYYAPGSRGEVEHAASELRKALPEYQIYTSDNQILLLPKKNRK